MKKILISLMSVSMLVPTISQIVACQIANEVEDPLTIGLGIDKSKALDSGAQNNPVSQFTNFFIVGDSLSDVNGVGPVLANQLEPVVNLFMKELLPNGILGMDIEIALNIALDGHGYGFTNQYGDYSAFSNGATAGYLLSDALGFEDIQNSSVFETQPNNGTVYGKNYAVGGATAAQMQGVSGALLNNVTVDRQIVSLLQQHLINANDLVLFEIGGNDLFAMIDAYGNKKEITRIFNEGINAIKKGLFTLLNNGIKKVIFMTPPKLNDIPKYNYLFSSTNTNDLELARFIDELGQKYNKAILSIIAEVNSYYNTGVEIFDLYNGFTDIVNWFKQTNPAAVVDKEFITSSDIFVVTGSGGLIIDEPYYQGDWLRDDRELYTIEEFIEILNGLGTSNTTLNNFNARIAYTIPLSLVMLALRETDDGEDINNYFFVDYVHPSAAVHEHVSKLLIDLITE